MRISLDHARAIAHRMLGKRYKLLPSCAWSKPKSVFACSLFFHPLGCVCCVLCVRKEMLNTPGRRLEKPLDDRMAMSSLGGWDSGGRPAVYCHRKGRMHPFVHLSIWFWLYTTLQCQSSISLNSLVFHTSGGISTSPATFLFIIFLSAESSSCVNGPSLMSNCLLLILVIGSCVTFGGFPSTRKSTESLKIVFLIVDEQ